MDFLPPESLFFFFWAPIYDILDGLMCCQGNCHSYYHHGEPVVGMFPTSRRSLLVGETWQTCILSIAVTSHQKEKRFYATARLRITTGWGVYAHMGFMKCKM